MVLESLVEVGNTPLICVDGIYAKLECTNPCGSIKDRIAKYIIEKSEEKGILRKGMKIIEATSGNTGIAFAFYGRQKGYAVTIIMPENMTEERKRVIRGFGATLIECSAEGSFAEAARIRDEMAKDPLYFNPDQFSNPLNVECHYQTTGCEILAQLAQIQKENAKKYTQKYTAKPIDAFIAGVGTGGTLIGVGKALKEAYPSVQIVAVEPKESSVMSGGKQGIHGIGGIGDGFIPAIVNDVNNSDGNSDGGLSNIINEVFCVSTNEAREAAQYLEREFGFCVGVSSGANFFAARKFAERFDTVVTVFPDGYPKYQSMGLESSHNCPYRKSQPIDSLVLK
ncbi:cysteine synthase family protein [Candidatus Woesearchaeota archaeon]|nr:cysteine synthase family protein [Candidatus Woesearchaeota archaeon]